MARTVEVFRYIEQDADALELAVVCEVSGRFVSASYNHPAEYPDVEVVAVVEDNAGRKPRPDLINLFENDASVLDDACVQASEDEEERRQDALERRADADREDRLLGEGRWAR